MLDANRSIVVINSYYDTSADEDKEVLTLLTDVSVHFGNAAASSSGGITDADIAKIRIPFRPNYLRAELWDEAKKAIISANAGTLSVDGNIGRMCYDSLGNVCVCSKNVTVCMDAYKTAHLCVSTNTQWTLRVGDTVMIDGKRKTLMCWRDNTNRRFEPHWYVEAR